MLWYQFINSYKIMIKCGTIVFFNNTIVKVSIIKRQDLTRKLSFLKVLFVYIHDNGNIHEKEKRRKILEYVTFQSHKRILLLNFFKESIIERKRTEFLGYFIHARVFIALTASINVRWTFAIEYYGTYVSYILTLISNKTHETLRYVF